jgi:hypothetical protein
MAEGGMWDRLMNAITAAHDGAIQMIDSTSITRGSPAGCDGRRKARHFEQPFRSDV